MSSSKTVIKASYAINLQYKEKSTFYYTKADKSGQMKSTEF
jgi:hypothetical protein